MKTSRQTYINVHRDAWVEVNLEYLAQNVKIIKNLIKPDVKLLAVVKVVGWGELHLLVENFQTIVIIIRPNKIERFMMLG